MSRPGTTNQPADETPALTPGRDQPAGEPPALTPGRDPAIGPSAGVPADQGGTTGSSSTPQNPEPSAGTSLRPAGPPGTVGVPVRLSEPAALRLVHAGNRVDLFRAGSDSAPVARDALVLEVTGIEDPLTGGLLLALTPAAAQETVRHTADGYVVVIRPDSPAPP